MILSKRILLLLLLLPLLLGTSAATAQATYGKITYERKTNLWKKYKDWEGVRDWLKPEDKSKVDLFELFFDDSLACFRPKEDGLKEQMSWATSKSTVYSNYNANDRFTIKEVWGEQVPVTDSLYHRQWKITSSKRNICGYSCRKAIWQANDSTRIYAWYTDAIVVSTGPESFYGLPGAILGLATEDGGVIYFAKSVEFTRPGAETLRSSIPKKKAMTSAALRAKLEKDYGQQKWGKAMLNETFGLW